MCIYKLIGWEMHVDFLDNAKHMEATSIDVFIYTSIELCSADMIRT